jgi:ribonuclease HI
MYAGWAWAQFRNSQGNGTVYTQDIITENYGPMQNLMLRDPVTQESEEIAMNSLHAELTAMVMALNYIKSDPLLINIKIVLCYDSQVAKGLITGDNKSHNSYSTNLVTAGRRALKETNNLRANAAKSRMPEGISPQSIVEANHIQFRWIKAHSGRDVGNAWVDARAKAGAYGNTPDNPIIGQESAPILSELDLSTLQPILTNHLKEGHNQVDMATDYLGTADPDIVIFDYYDDRPQDLF